MTETTAANAAGESMLALMVYFTLLDASEENMQQMLAACHKYLTGHPGVVFYGAGTCATCYDRPVNDRDVHVALHIVFSDRKAHDAYQVAPAHEQFISEGKPNWKQGRVFDSDVG